MRLLPSDPDIETIIGRIKNGDIDLQPDFQRGEVWSIPKQKKLVDSILRDWHVPPIHLVQQSDSNQLDVLDGQQRLVAIRDFTGGLFRVDGKTEPVNDEIEALDGLTYEELPPRWRRQFDQFTIRMFRVVDFHPDESAELFFRLNQSVTLTTAEQRNAFFGPVREQVKELVSIFHSIPIGFTNSRMALDDVVARLCLSVERQTIRDKMTSSQLADRYRLKEPFSSHTIYFCRKGIELFSASADQWDGKVKLNKATLFSWFWVAVNAAETPNAVQTLASALPYVESLRRAKFEEMPLTLSLQSGRQLPLDRYFSLVQMYYDRSSSRVSDVTSVIARDFFLWLTMSTVSADQQTGFLHPLLDRVEKHVGKYLEDIDVSTNELVLDLVDCQDWGGLP